MFTNCHFVPYNRNANKICINKKKKIKEIDFHFSH